MARFPLLLGATALAALLITTDAHATLQRAIEFDQKVDEAAAIVLAKVARTHSQWDPSHRWILTYSTFTVEQTLKGSAPAEVTLVTPGGAVGNVIQSTIGIRPFREGDENVVFIKNTSSGPTVLYFDQGAYDVKADDRGEKMIVPVSTGAVHIDPQRGTAVESERPRTMRDFTRDVHDSMERVRASKMQLVNKRNRPQQQASFTETVSKYKLLFALALVGALLATVHVIRR
jgi:hypothetical protein